MMPILQVGPVALPTPALIILLGIWLGLSLAERYALRHGVKADTIFNLALTGMLAGVVGSRLAYVMRYPQAFMANPLDIFSRNLGLFDPGAGVLIGLLVVAIYIQRKQIAWLSLLDAITPALAVLAIGISVSNLASGSAYGAAAELPWSIELWGMRRHPSQVYESIAAIIILIYLWPGRNQVATRKTGVYFLHFLAFSAGIRLFLEAFRGDVVPTLLGIRPAQIVSWIVLALTLFAIGRVMSLPEQSKSGNNLESTGGS